MKMTTDFTIKDPEKYRHLLLEEALLDFLKDSFTAMRNDIDLSTILPSLTAKTISKIRDIERADFEENFNPNHAKE